MAASTLRYAVSWSGGKDSALAMTRAWRVLGAPHALITMMIEDGQRSRSHGLRRNVLQAQADALDVPLRVHSTSWADYEAIFTTELHQLHDQGVTAVVFGDIALEEHRLWCVRVCDEAGMAAIHPLWNEERRDVIREFMLQDFSAAIIAVQDGKLPQSLLGMDLAYGSTVDTIFEHDADLCGENGEYHTLVTRMPLFRQALSPSFGPPVLRDGYWFVDAMIG